MGATLRGTATKKRYGRGWRRARERGATSWAERKARSQTYCRQGGGAVVAAAPDRRTAGGGGREGR